MKNKVYVIESYFSDGGDLSEYITEGVYSDPIIAEELSRKIAEEYLIDLNIPEPMPKVEGSYTKEDHTIWFNWSEKHDAALDFKECYVREVTLNERVKI